MSQDKDLSSLSPVKPDPGTYQWVKAKATGTDDKQTERTHTAGVPPLIPGTIIFVHGVNSEGEYFISAADGRRSVQPEPARIQCGCHRGRSRQGLSRAA